MRQISINLPDFNAMSDEEMQKSPLTASLDGRWSALTRWLVESWETDQLDLNSGWSKTWQGWTCPACNRKKYQIARVTESGVLLCRLEEHHDHLGDLATLIFRNKIAGDVTNERARDQRLAFAKVYPLIERFDRTLICTDCNAADAAMKAAIAPDTHRNFSFSPSEIGQFVIAQPFMPHGINCDQGRAIWLEAKKEFEDRVAFAEMMATRVVQGRHDRERSEFFGRTEFDDAKLLHQLAYEQLSVRDQPRNLSESLIARSRAVVVRATPPTKDRRAIVKVPAHSDFVTLDTARKSQSKPWRNAGDNWCCGVCARNKFQIMRWSNARKWTANIFQLADYVEEQDDECVRRRKFQRAGSLVLSLGKTVTVCHDCRLIITDAVTLVTDAEPNCLRTSDIAQLIGDVVPHQRHQVSPIDIIEAVRRNTEWIAAVEDFEMHRGEAIEISLEHYRIQKGKGASYKEARREVIPLLVKSGKIPALDAEGWFDWFMAEHQRHNDQK